MPDECDPWTAENEPPPEDFFLDEEEEPPASPRATVLRMLRVAGVLLLVLALLLYFVVPFRVAVVEAWHHWRPPLMRTIPLAPEPTSTVRLAS